MANTFEKFKSNLEAGCPDHDDQFVLDKIRRLHELRRHGKTWKEIATAMGYATVHNARGFLYSDKAKVGIEYLKKAENIGDLPTAREAAVSNEVEILQQRADDDADTLVREARRDACALTPEVVAYWKKCLQKDAKGDMLNDGNAMWASQQVAKATGLAEPPRAMGAGALVLQFGNAAAEREAMDADDEEAARFARAIDITPTPQPTGGATA